MGACRRLAVGVLGACVAVSCPTAARAQRRADLPSPMQPHRAARITIACDDARSIDWQHYVLAGTLIGTGAVLYLPSFFEDQSTLPGIASLQRGLGAGMVIGGAALLLRPYTDPASRLVETCDRLHLRDPDNPIVLRDAERGLNALAVGQRLYDLEIGLLATGITVLGATASLAAISDPHDRLFWAGVFFAAPLALWLELAVPSPPVRAGLRFHGGHYRVPRETFTVLPTANGVMVRF